MFWVGTPFSPVEVQRHLVGAYCLHILGRRVSQERNQEEGKIIVEEVQMKRFPEISRHGQDNNTKIYLRYSRSNSMNWTELLSFLLLVGCLIGLLFNPEDGGNMFFQKRWLPSTRLHGVAAYKCPLLLHSRMLIITSLITYLLTEQSPS
jgi:hypothetical protein